jgi:hypothetical protein
LPLPTADRYSRILGRGRERHGALAPLDVSADTLGAPSGADNAFDIYTVDGIQIGSVTGP